MDPNANLEEQRAIIARLRDAGDQAQSLTSRELETLAYRLVDLVDSLDVWLGRGGYLPNDWQRRGAR